MSDRNWECVECGYVHRRNVNNCSSCSHTILKQTDAEPTSFLGRLLSKIGV